ncbi:hypothetical protein DPEC_G00061340 [Dallia pectoralis]|uniref:Uncharacterized protein n=1 Tax=Dallia pectoralis TaxID=75939 RepID=A0ACC2H7T4_DALPE|nr:hypothetical protein DPEC_G00061340 [Dallia pectoralis]
MDLKLLARVADELDSSEVAALCFLSRDVLNRKDLEKVEIGYNLFQKLQEKGLLEDNHFLSQLLKVIGRQDLVLLLETCTRQAEPPGNTQTDACPILSQFRVMLYKVSEDVTMDYLKKIKFMLIEKVPKGRLDPCTTALEVLCEMERQNLLTENKLDELLSILQLCDTQLANHVTKHIQARSSLSMQGPYAQPISNQGHQRSSDLTRNPSLSLETLSVSETSPIRESRQTVDLFPDAVAPPSTPVRMERYVMTSKPRGTCLIINNEYFQVNSRLTDRPGTAQDERSLTSVFTKLGFIVEVKNDLPMEDMISAVEELGGRNHLQADALVVCVLSHGEKGSVFGTDGKEAPIRSLTSPFTSIRCWSLTGKPKMFFIQACQGKGYQTGTPILPSKPDQEERYEADAGAAESVPSDADFLMGMATVEECKSFRDIKTGSIYIQELCKQLEWGARSEEDILSVLTRVNREVSKGVFLKSKQMPEPKYTLTKKLFLPYR